MAISYFNELSPMPVMFLYFWKKKYGETTHSSRKYIYVLEEIEYKSVSFQELSPLLKCR